MSTDTPQVLAVVIAMNGNGDIKDSQVYSTEKRDIYSR